MLGVNVEIDKTGVSLGCRSWRLSAYHDPMIFWRVGLCGLSAEGDFRTWGVQFGRCVFEIARDDVSGGEWSPMPSAG